MNKLKNIIFILVMVIIISFSVNAEENESGGGAGQTFGEPVQEFDDTGRVISGEINWIFYRNSDGDVYEYIFNGENKPAYVEKKSVKINGEDGYTYILHPINGSVDYTLIINDIPHAGLSRRLSESNGRSDQYQLFSEYLHPNTGSSFKSYSILQYCSYPIFSSDDENYQNNVDNYINNGDVSGAENRDDVSRDPEYDSNIELPQKFRVLDGYSYLLKDRIKKVNKDVIVKWEQTVDTTDYKYDVLVSFQYDDVSNDFDNLSSTDIYYSNSIPYNGTKNMSLTINQDWINNHLTDLYSHQHMLQNSSHPQSTCYLRSMIIKVRNKVGNDSSHFVETKINFTDKTARASEKDENGNTVDNAQYDNTDVINNEDDINGDNVGSLSDFSKIIEFVKSGFGVFGQNGFVSLLSSFFGNVFPQSFWNLIVLGIGVIILIGIINFLLKR